MTTQEWLQGASQKLKKAGIGTAELDVELLLADILGVSRAHLLAHPGKVLTKAQLSRLDNQIKRRVKHEPLAYIRGKAEFFGREFVVDRRVLVPRPESETMIEMLKHLVDSQQLTVGSKTQIVDVGTGSGALAVTIKLEIPEAKVLATDIDQNCLTVARHNAQKHQASDITFLHADLLTTPRKDSQKSSGRIKFANILLCNLPYVPNDFGVNRAALHEPHQAIFGGKDGLDLYRKLFKQISTIKVKPSYVLTESLPPQHHKLTQIAKKHGYTLQQTEDFIQIFNRS